MITSSYRPRRSTKARPCSRRRRGPGAASGPRPTLGDPTSDRFEPGCRRAFPLLNGPHLQSPHHAQLDRSVSTEADGSSDIGGANIRYEPDDLCPPLTLVGVGLQGMLLILATIVATVAVTGWGGNQDDAYLQWAVFAALMVAGGLIALQASRVWQIGTEHLVLMGPSANFVAVSVLALEGRRACSHGEPHRRFVSLLPDAGAVAAAAATDHHPCRHRHRRHAHRGVGLSDRAGPDPGCPRGCVERGGACRRGGDAGGGHCAGLAGAAGPATLVAGAGSAGRMRDGGLVRELRPPAGARRGLGRHPDRRVRRAGPDLRLGLLDAATGVRGGDPHGRRQEHRRQRHRATGLTAHAQSYRLSPGAGRAQGQLLRDPAVGPRRHGGDNLLHVAHSDADHSHIGGRPAGRLRDRSRHRGAGPLPQALGRADLDPRAL